jgi:hypothetical protein
MGATQPRVVDAMRWTWARPALVLVLLDAVVVGSLGAVISGGDALWFRTAGSGMLGHRFFDVFEASGLQIGPVYLVVLGLLDRVARLLHLPELFTLAAVQSAAVAWLAVWTARRAARAVQMPVLPAQWAVGLVLVLGGFLAEGVGNGHPEEIAVALILANAGLSAASGRHVVAGVLVGLATGVKQWGAFGGGLVLLGGRRVRSTAIGAVVAAATAAALYAPFAIWGHIATFDFAWGIPRNTLLAHIGGWAGSSDWDLRLVQGAAAALTGAALAWRRRGSPLVPVVAAVAMRLFLDPLRLTYYSGPFVAVALIWLWSTGAPVVRRWRLAVTCSSPIVVLLPYMLRTGPLWWAGTVALVAGTAAVVWFDRRVSWPGSELARPLD